jgi:lysophospholipase L1-like esterase
MAAIVREIDARLLLVHIPQKGPWREMHRYPAERLGGWAEKNGVGLVDVLPAMAEASGGKPLYYELDGHCTPEGYGVVAQAIFHHMTAHRLVP